MKAEPEPHRHIGHIEEKQKDKDKRKVSNEDCRQSANRIKE